MEQRTNLAERLGAAEKLIKKVIMNAVAGENVKFITLSLQNLQGGMPGHCLNFNNLDIKIRVEVEGKRD